MMKKLLPLLPLLSGVVATTSCTTTQSEESKPNVIYILTDDLGYGELGCYGQTKIETPNIDALTKTGVRFTQNYAGAPVSAPSRSVLMTGLHLGHTPIRGNDAMGKRGDVWNHQAMLDDAGLEGQAPMGADTKTLGHLMKQGGYATGIIGKWGLGYPGSVSTPGKMGFDFFYGLNCQRLAHTFYPMFLYRNDTREYLNNAPLLNPTEKLDEGADIYDKASYEKFNRKDYMGDLMFDEVISFVDKNKEEPFFLMWTTPIPHAALQVPTKWIEYYEEKFGAEEPYLGNKGYLPSRSPRATYAAMISYLDEQVGVLVEKLKADGIYENTIIVFTSDNGPTYNGGTDSEWFNSTGELRNNSRSIKGSVGEGGIRVPLIVSWPAKIKEARTSDHICAFWDTMPTLADITNQESYPTDGISYLPELLGETQAAHEFLYWEFAPASGGSRAIRMGNMKGIISNIKKGNDTMELYDLSKDIKEMNDIAADYPEIVKKMRAIMKQEHTPSTNPNFVFFTEE